mgnify:FL=1
MLQLLGSQLGFILVLIIGVVILCIVDKFKRNKMSNEQSDDCLGCIATIGFVFAAICAILYNCTNLDH